MQPLYSRAALGAVFLTIGLAAAFPALAASPISSQKNLFGEILASPDEFTLVTQVAADSSSTFIKKEYPAAPDTPRASFVGDTGNGRLGVAVEAANGQFLSSSASYVETVTNTTDQAVDVYFSFYLKAGQVQILNTPTPETETFWNGSASFNGNIVWDTLENFETSTPIWSVSAGLFGDADFGFDGFSETSRGLGFTFAQTDVGFTFGDYSQTLLLGSLAAGETRRLGYSLYADAFYDEGFCGCGEETVTRFSAILDGPAGGHAAAGAFDPFGVTTRPGVQFLAVSVPEPSTWVMLGAGLLVAAGAARRGRRAA